MSWILASPKWACRPGQGGKRIVVCQILTNTSKFYPLSAFSLYWSILAIKDGICARKDKILYCTLHWRVSTLYYTTIGKMPWIQSNDNDIHSNTWVCIRRINWRSFCRWFLRNLREICIKPVNIKIMKYFLLFINLMFYCEGPLS